MLLRASTRPRAGTLEVVRGVTGRIKWPRVHYRAPVARRLQRQGRALFGPLQVLAIGLHARAAPRSSRSYIRRAHFNHTLTIGSDTKENEPH